jgi:hypothetical protein
MNLTVGPLPPAVYWRRRVLVLGAVLVLVLFLVAMCGGSSKPKATGTQPTARVTSASASPAGTPSVQPPIVGAPGGGSGAPSSAASASPTAAGSAAPPSDLCADGELQLTPAVQKITGGSYPYQLNLVIRNVSGRSCRRDIGSGPQEMHILNAAGQTLWSSDYCQSNPGSDVRTFGPNIEAAFQLGWDGYGYGPGCVKGAKLVDGSYQIVAKLDTKVSAPVAFTISAGK